MNRLLSLVMFTCVGLAAVVGVGFLWFWYGQPGQAQPNPSSAKNPADGTAAVTVEVVTPRRKRSFSTRLVGNSIPDGLPSLISAKLCSGDARRQLSKQYLLSDPRFPPARAATRIRAVLSKHPRMGIVLQIR